jgi:hypothetical protein
MTQLHISTDVDIISLVNQFNTQNITQEQWTHESHLAVACWHLHTYHFFDALCRMRAGIILLNGAHGTPNNQDRGYHETLTWFWLTVVDLWITNHPEMTLIEQYQSLLNSPASSKYLPRAYYLESELKDPFTRAITLKPTQQELSWQSIGAIEPVHLQL